MGHRSHGCGHCSNWAGLCSNDKQRHPHSSRCRDHPFRQSPIFHLPRLPARDLPNRYPGKSCRVCICVEPLFRNLYGIFYIMDSGALRRTCCLCLSCRSLSSCDCGHQLARTSHQRRRSGKNLALEPQSVTDTEPLPMNNPIRFTGRVLYLSCNPDAVRRQLAGENLTLAECLPLRDDVSTDEITPTTIMMTYDERLGRYPYVGLEAGGEMPIGTDAIKNGGFGITVAGKRYGKGSSRESSPLAEISAGIRLIVAESFERIYRQNCDNIGIMTTTDFTVLDRIAAGEAIPLEEFLTGRDQLTQDIIRSGGLLPYSKVHLSGGPQGTQGEARAC